MIPRGRWSLVGCDSDLQVMSMLVVSLVMGMRARHSSLPLVSSTGIDWPLLEAVRVWVGSQASGRK